MNKIGKLDSPFPLDWYPVLVASTLAYFLFKLIFLATTVNPAIPPDELRHLQLSLHYSSYQGLILPDIPQTYQFGPVSRQPYLYHWVMGRALIFSTSIYRVLIYSLFYILSSIFLNG